MISIGLDQRPVWLIESDATHATVTECGAHVAEIVRKPAGVNPLWIQDRPTIDSDRFDPAAHGGIYGTDSEAKLLAGLAGHNLCLPFWGPPSEDEFRAGIVCHGETNVIRWRELEHTGASLRIEAHLRESGIRVERKLSCIGSFLAFETVAENLTSLDRPLAWCEHVSFGPPFLEPQQTRFVADLGRGYRTSGDWNDSFHWPEGRGEIACDLSRFSELPHSELVNSFLVEAQREWACFAAWNQQSRLLLGYTFRVADFPWLNVWENNDTRRRTRGMEFSNTPIEGSLRKLVATPHVYGVPTFEWLGARSLLRKMFFAFSVPLPEGYHGVESIAFDGKTLTVREAGGPGAIELSLTQG